MSLGYLAEDEQLKHKPHLTPSISQIKRENLHAKPLEYQ
jgi:hypothetical protein